MRLLRSVVGRFHLAWLRPLAVAVSVAAVAGVSTPALAATERSPSIAALPKPVSASTARARNARRAAAGYDWQSKGHDNSQSAYVNDPNMDATIAPKLGVSWMTNLLSADVGGPTVAFNPTFGKALVYSGNERGDLSAIDQVAGQFVWSTSVGVGDSIYATPLISSDQSSVWIATAYKPNLYKINTATGAIQCAEHQLLPFQASPTEGQASDGTEQVYISTIDGPAGAGPELAYRESDCALVFSSNHYNVPLTGSWASPSYGIDAKGRRLVFQGTADPDSTEYAIDATTGELSWYFVTDQRGDNDIGAASTVSPPGKNGIADGVVYVINKSEICYAVDLTTGKLLWKYAFAQSPAKQPGSSISTAALDGNTLVFGMNDGVYALNATTGAKRWHYVDPTQNEVISSPAIVGPPGAEVVAFADVSGEFSVLRLRDGKALYHYQTGNYITASPSYYNGNFFITSADGFLYDFAAGGGNGAPPKSGITSPTQGSNVPYAATITISGTASDARGVSAVQVGVQFGGPSGAWYNAATGTTSSGALTNTVAVAKPGATSTTWTMSVPIPPTGTTVQVTANAVNVAHLADVKGAGVTFSVSGSSAQPRLRTSAVFIAPGATFVATGYGFAANEQVKFSVAGAVIGTGQADGSGKVSASLTLPTASLFGVTPLSGTGGQSQKTGYVAIDIANAWLQAGYDPGHTAFEPNDLTFQHLISPGGNKFLGRAWYYLAGAPVESSPSVYDGAVYFGNDAGTLTAIGADSAAPLWALTIPSGAAIRSTPAIDPSTGNLAFTADDGNVYVASAAGGTQTGSASIGGLPTSPNIHNGVIYVGSDNATLTALDEATGTRKWTDTLAAAVHTTPALDITTGNLVVGDDSGAVSAFNAASGHLLWQVKTGGPVTATPTIANGIVYAGSADGHLYALQETSGAKVWTYASPTPITTGSPYDPVLSLIYIGGTNGIVSAVDIATGTLQWTTQQQSPQSAIAGMSSANAFVFSSESVGSLLAYRSKQFGRLNAALATGAALTTAAAINDGTIYLGASDGGVYAFTAYGGSPQKIPAAIRRANAELATALPPRAWAAVAARVSSAPRFGWTGQRDVAVHIDATTRRSGAVAAPLSYHGGPVQKAPLRYVVFWKPAGTALESTYIPAVSAALQAGSGPGVGKLAGGFIDTAPAPAQMSDAALQGQIAKVIAANRWPTGVNSQFLILTAGGMLPPNPGFCSYHSAFNLGHDRTKPVIYAVVPYSGALSACGTPSRVGSRSGDPAIDAATANLSRVQQEMANDPLLTGWYGSDGGEVRSAF